MTFIRRLSSKGFKSFAQRTDLEFGQKFNTVIGPNGAGKSNIVDAICFVLGKSSAKGMRASKSPHLIYNGGKTKNPAKEAEVTIEFDNSKKQFPFEDSLIRVTRILKQNGTSIYKINDKVLTRQQVVDVLNAAQIDADGHNIILQGDVIHFIESKPIEKRQIIEEISGISMYEEKKQKSLHELGKVDEKLHETSIILTEREAHLKELKKDRDQALQYKELERNIRDDKFTLTSSFIKEKKEKLENIEKQKEEMEKKVLKSEEEIESLKKEIQGFKEHIKNINEELDHKGEKEQILLRKNIEDLKTGLARSSTRLENCHQELKKIQERKKQLDLNNKDLDQKTQEIKEQEKILEKGLQELRKREQELEKSVHEFKKEHSINDDLSKNFDGLENEIENKILSIDKLQLKKQEFLRHDDQYQFKLKYLEEKLRTLRGSGKKAEIASLKEKKKRYSDAEKKLEDSFSKETSLTKEVSNLRQNYLLKNNELSRYLARQVHIKEKAHSDLAVRKIIEFKNHMKGIHSTVAELGKVDSRYSLALEIAAGSRIQSIVVDNDTVAQKCIEYLKENKLGTATFLPLNKIQGRRFEAGIEVLGKKCHGLALHLVDYDPLYKEVFSFVFGSSLIVDDISAARRLGIGRARMVTLEGDLLDQSGAMVGGYRSRGTGLGFIEKELSHTIQDLEKHLASVKKTIDSIESERSESEVSISSLRKEKAHLEAEIITLEKTLDIHGLDLPKLQEEEKFLIEQQKDTQKEIQSLEKEISAELKVMDSLKEKKNIIKQKINDPKLTGKLEALKNQKIQIKEEMIGLEAKKENIQTQIQTMLLPEKERSVKIMKEQEKDFELFQNEIINLQTLIKEREQELKEKEVQEKKLFSNFKDFIQKRNQMSDRIQKKEMMIVREEERVRSHQSKVHGLSLERAKIAAELEGLHKELEMYQGGIMKKGVSIEQVKQRIKENEKIFAKIGNINLRALEVYEDIEREYGIVLEKVHTLKGEKEDVLELIRDVESKKKEIFLKTYNEITGNFKKIFNSLSQKGEAQVELENPDDPFDGGIDIKIKLTGNKYLDLKSLSGGEKSLAALSFIFAIQEYNPSPFYLLDEVDAALDKRNSEVLSKLIMKYADKSQYIVISHNDALISDADQIYGISMKEGISKIVSLKV